MENLNSKSIIHKLLYLKEKSNIQCFKDFNSLTSVFISTDEEFFPIKNTLIINAYVGQQKDTYLNLISDDLQYLYDIDCEDVTDHLGVFKNKLKRLKNK